MLAPTFEEIRNLHRQLDEAYKQLAITEGDLDKYKKANGQLAQMWADTKDDLDEARQALAVCGTKTELLKKQNERWLQRAKQLRKQRDSRYEKEHVDVLWEAIREWEQKCERQEKRINELTILVNDADLAAEKNEEQRKGLRNELRRASTNIQDFVERRATEIAQLQNELNRMDRKVRNSEEARNRMREWAKRKLVEEEALRKRVDTLEYERSMYEEAFLAELKEHKETQELSAGRLSDIDSLKKTLAFQVALVEQVTAQRDEAVDSLRCQKRNIECNEGEIAYLEKELNAVKQLHKQEAALANSLWEQLSAMTRDRDILKQQRDSVTADSCKFQESTHNLTEANKSLRQSIAVLNQQIAEQWEAIQAQRTRFLQYKKLVKMLERALECNDVSFIKLTADDMTLDADDFFANDDK